MEKNYPDYRKQLQGFIKKLRSDIPDTMSGFQQLHKHATAEGTLSPKVKELISLGIAVTAQCDGCIAMHTYDALKAGATRAEITEAIGVAVLMGGGPALMYGAEALRALEQFEADQ